MQLPLFQQSSVPFYNLTVLNANHEIESDVIVLKKLVRDVLGEEYPSLYSKAHITLTSFVGPESWNLKINEAVEMTGHLQAPMCFETESFGFFKNGSGYVIYIAVNNHSRFNKLQSNLLLEHAKRFVLPRKAENRHISATPHITVARGLAQQQFDCVWPVFEARRYRKAFVAESIILLRKSDLQKSVVVGKFPLRG